MERADGLPTDVLLEALLGALESAGIGCTVVVDREGSLKRVYSNEPAAKMFGVTVDELNRTPPLLALTSEERARLGAMRANPHGSEVPSVETKVKRADGSVLPVEAAMGTMPLRRGEGRAIVAFLRDLTPRIAMEAAIRESEERFRTIAESSPDSITLVAEGRYVYANPVAMRILGISTPEELARFEPISAVPPGREAEARERGARIYAGEVVPTLEITSKLDGRDVFLEASTRLTSFAGKPALVTYARDITERKELQARLMAQDRLAAVGTLAAGLAHELNNPLTYLSFHLKRLHDLLAARGAEEEREALTEIEEGAQRMQSVIADLLFLTRESELPQAHVDVRHVLVSTLSLVRAGTRNGARITSDLAESSGILGHPSRLGQVFLNVMANALDAVADRSDGVVHVALRESGGWVEVTIADNGPGVPEAVRPRAFDPFYTTKPEGTGLGLSISHAIVSAHGGQISLDNRPGGGAVVTIRLPTSSDSTPSP